MIRALNKSDVNRVADIWLDTNLKTHSFISAQYWVNNYSLVKEMLSQSEVYVYENCQGIYGFVGINGEHIEGIFVADEMQGNGIGNLFMNYLKSKKETLSLNVYQKNKGAIRFYRREGFEIQCESLDKATDEKEYIMTWKK